MDEKFMHKPKEYYESYEIADRVDFEFLKAFFSDIFQKIHATWQMNFIEKEKIGYQGGLFGASLFDSDTRKMRIHKEEIKK